MIRRILASCLLLAAVVMPALSFAGTAAAFDPLGQACSGAGSSSAACDSSSAPVLGDENIFLKAARLIAIIAGAAAVILVIVSGIQIITANGDANQVANGRRTILYAIAGLFIIALAQAIITLVVKGLS